jgi:hypothetical protein
MTLKSYIVLYRIESIMCPADAPFQFGCLAENSDHAEEQCLNAYGEVDVVWVAETDYAEDAWEDYYSCGPKVDNEILDTWEQKNKNLFATP